MSAFFTLLYRISPDDVESLLDPELEENLESSIFLRSIGDMELIALWETIEGESGGTIISEPLADPDEVMVLGVDEGFLNSIRNLSVDDMESVATKWASHELMTHWEVPDLVEQIQSIRTLINDADKGNEIVVQVFSL